MVVGAVDDDCAIVVIDCAALEDCVVADDELSRVALEDGVVLEDCGMLDDSAIVVVACAALDACTDVALDAGTDAALEDRGAVFEYCTEFEDAALEDRTEFEDGAALAEDCAIDEDDHTIFVESLTV